MPSYALIALISLFSFDLFANSEPSTNLCQPFEGVYLDEHGHRFFIESIDENDNLYEFLGLQLIIDGQYHPLDISLTDPARRPADDELQYKMECSENGILLRIVSLNSSTKLTLSFEFNENFVLSPRLVEGSLLQRLFFFLNPRNFRPAFLKIE